MANLATDTLASWTCPTCGSTHPGDFAVCPRDATPRAEGSAVATDPLIGAVLAHTYRVVKVLGEGGMARLYEAEHLRVDTRYAVKVIHDDLSRIPDLLARFEREARAAGRISSENVVRLVDVLRTADGRPCIVTELLEGEDLQTHLNKIEGGKLAPAVAIPIARQIARALAAAHAVGVVHRDLKPSNVFLCTGGAVKVFDFGVAKLDDDDRLTRTDAVMGTPAYMAPEQARRAVDAGPLADVYSVGAVLYHMLTGEPPYGKAPAASRFALVLHEEPSRPRELEPSIPEGLESVIQHAMARDPAQRLASALALDEELEAFDTTPPPPPIVEAPAPAPAPRDARAPQPKAAAPASPAASVPSLPAARAPKATTDMITLRARLARPGATFLVAASSLAAGLWLAALLAAVIASPPYTGTEKSLIGLLGAVAGVAVAALQIRLLRPRWRSAPAVLQHDKVVGRALLAALATLGALELIAHGVAALGASTSGAAWRLAVAGGAAALALGWRAIGGDALLKRFTR